MQDGNSNALYAKLRVECMHMVAGKVPQLAATAGVSEKQQIAATCITYLLAVLPLLVNRLNITITITSSSSHSAGTAGIGKQSLHPPTPNYPQQ